MVASLFWEQSVNSSNLAIVNDRISMIIGALLASAFPVVVALVLVESL